MQSQVSEIQRVQNGMAERLIVPIETLNRELDAKLLLAYLAAERGFSVVFGSKREIHHRIDKFKPAIYLGKSLTAKNATLYEILETLGHTIVSTDEEGLVYYTPETYKEAKVGPDTLRRVKLLFAWGLENARNWESFDAYHGAPICLIGNPRLDLLRPEFGSYWADEVKQLRKRYGRFILINSNFGKINHYRSDMGHLDKYLGQAPENATESERFHYDLTRYRYRLFKEFLAAYHELAKAFPDVSVVVRPHPSEAHGPWERAASGAKNVHIVHEGNVVPWLIASEAVVHNGCTTGIEAFILGKPVIAYQPVRDDRYDIPLPNDISLQVFDPGRLREVLGSVLAGDANIPGRQETNGRDLIGRHICGLQGALSSERLLNHLESLNEEKSATIGAMELARLRLRARFTGTRLRRRLKSPFKRKQYAHRYRYHRRIFPGIAIADIESRIRRLEAIFGEGSDVSVRAVDKNIFELRSRRHRP